MQQILSVWSTLDTRRRVIVLGATIAMFAAILGLSRMAAQPSMALLYAGLEPGAAGDVVVALDQQDVAYDIRNGSIFVDVSRRDALRMTLAAEGLPSNNGQGYELLDSLTGFGTTSQMFDAAYWRAKEGELARTIVTSPQIRTARVHISNPSSNPFQRDLKSTASVSVTTGVGSLTAAHANALKYLVASAVAGMSPEDVSVIDGRGTLVASGDEAAMSGRAGGDRAAELRRNVQRLIEARVGAGNAVVEVNVETGTERESIVEHRFDPDSRIAISSETEERTTSSSGSQNSAVTVASNLPEGDAGGGENNSRSENSETRERINYEVSETTREILRNPGGVRRISVAVLIDGLRSIDPATGEEIWQPRAPEEMEALRDLVASAIGFDADRGDTITLKTMEFKPVAAVDTLAPPSFMQSLNLDMLSLMQVAILALVSLVLGLFVIRPILQTRASGVTAALAAPVGAPAAGLPVGSTTILRTGSPTEQQINAPLHVASAAQVGSIHSAALTGEIDDGHGPMPDLAVVSPRELVSGSGTSGDASSGETTDPVGRLRALIEERRDETVEILRGWLEDHEEPV